jgi:hypothetical protein
MNRLTLWITPPGAAAAVPVLSALGGEIVLTELGMFEASSVTLAAGVFDDAGVSAAERAILAMQPYTLVEVVEEGVGTLSFGYVLNPSQQISDRGEDTITLKLEPLTTELTWRRLGRDFEVESFLSVVANRIATTAPGWVGTFDGQGTAADITVLFGSNNETVVGGFLSAMAQFAQFARLGADATGAPVRVLEGGQFGADSGVTIQDAKGGDPEAMAKNRSIRLVATLDRSPNNVEELCNVTVPFGGGQDDDSLVTLERPWRIVNDPSYPNYGRWGTDAEAYARTAGKFATSVFPEYDHANYPISDPENPPAGGTLYDASGNLVQGAVGTRRATGKGRWDYMVFDRASYATYGHKETKDYIDSTLTYQGNNPADQEQTARALYLSIVGYFERFAHPHHTITVATNTADTRPPRAGEIVHLDYQKQSRASDGTLVEVSEVGSYRAMKVVRSFPTDGSAPYDTYTLSNLGRFDQDDAQQQADMSRTIVALARNQGTSIAPFYVPWVENIDALNPIIIPFFIPAAHFRYHQVRVQVDFYPFRGTATTAVNSAATITLSVPHGTHNVAPQPGHAFGATGISTANAPVPSVENHRHSISVGSFPSSTTANLHIEPNGSMGIPGGSNAGVTINTSSQIANDSTEHAHTMPIQQALALEHPDTLSAPLPQHTHDVEKRIPTGTPSPASIAFSINGVFLSSGAAVTGARDSSGAFTGSFVVDDIGPTLDQYPPLSVVPLRFDAGTSAGNPFGVGYLRVMIVGVEESGGLANTVRLTS